MVHDTHGIYSKIINEIGNLSVLLLRLPLKMQTLSHYLMKRVEQCYKVKALRTSFVDKGQLTPSRPSTKYPSPLEKFSSKRFHMTPRPPY